MLAHRIMLFPSINMVITDEKIGRNIGKIMAEFADILWEFDDYLWYIPFVLIIALGVYSTVRFKGIQFTRLKEMFKITFSREKRPEGRITPFQVFCVSMGNRVGIGNIAGPVTAILTGGPGAVFWMWVFASLGGATAFVESTVGQLFKSHDRDGNYKGGPAYNISKGLGYKKFGMAVAFLMIMMYIIGYISSEVSAMSEAFTGAFEFEHNALVFSISMTVLAAIIVFGGLKRVAHVSSVVVPVMALGWIVLCIGIILFNWQHIGDAFAMIFRYAFSPPAFVGGLAGALIIGMRRGIWSNEAGIGTITNVSSIADVDHPAQQGLSQSLGVLFDTLICTMTAFVVLAFSGFDAAVEIGEDSMPYLQSIFEDAIGGSAPAIVFVFIFLFAITCFMGDVVIGENNLKFITESEYARYGMIALVLVVVFVSCFWASDTVFAVLDILLALCGIINVFVILKLSGRAAEVYKDYRRQKAAGIEKPVFDPSVLSDSTGVTEWPPAALRASTDAKASAEPEE